MISWPRCGAHVRQRPSAVVPAVAARVLAAGHAEVERRVEGVELVGGVLALVVAPGGGHRLVERRLVAHDVVLQTLRRGLEATDAPLGLRGRVGFERVARAAAFAEGLGQDLGHRAPGVPRRTTAGRDGRPNGRRVYRTGLERPQPQVPPIRADGPAGSRRRESRGRTAETCNADCPCAAREPKGDPARLRHRSCDPSPPSSGSSSASSRGSRPACSTRSSSRSSSSAASSGRWSRVGSRDGDRTIVPHRFAVHLDAGGPRRAPRGPPDARRRPRRRRPRVRPQPPLPAGRPADGRPRRGRRDRGRRRRSSRPAGESEHADDAAVVAPAGPTLPPASRPRCSSSRPSMRRGPASARSGPTARAGRSASTAGP